MSGVTLKKVTKSFDETKVIHGVNLEIPDGELCVFVGPSGCGKSTLLRMIAGLEQVTSGSIEIGSRDVTLLILRIVVWPWFFKIMRFILI